MGSCTDAEINGPATTSPVAPMGDDTSNSGVFTGEAGSCTNDEDGLGTIENVWGDGQATIQVDVQGTGGQTSCVYGWIDWDGDGFGDETFASSEVSSDRTTALTYTSGSHGVPTSGCFPSSVYIRLRVVPSSCVTIQPFGLQSGNEVEDHQVGFTPTPINLKTITAKVPYNVQSFMG